jgi:hypothetical protein
MRRASDNFWIPAWVEMDYKQANVRHRACELLEALRDKTGLARLQDFFLKT